MSSAPRSIDEYLRQLRDALKGADPALIQDALYDAEEYLRAEVAANPGKSEADVLELIASTYGAPEEVAARIGIRKRRLLQRFGPCSPRALSRRIRSSGSSGSTWTHEPTLFMACGQTFSAGTAPRWARITDMLKDSRTWTTLAYLLLMLPLGIIYFTIAVVGISLGVALIAAPFAVLVQWLGWFPPGGPHLEIHSDWFGSPIGALFAAAFGVLVLTASMHGARGLGRAHVALARALLVRPGT